MVARGTDGMELEIKRIVAVSQVQDSLNDKLGYDSQSDSAPRKTTEQDAEKGKRKRTSQKHEEKEPLKKKKARKEECFDEGASAIQDGVLSRLRMADV